MGEFPSFLSRQKKARALPLAWLGRARLNRKESIVEKTGETLVDGAHTLTDDVIDDFGTAGISVDQALNHARGPDASVDFSGGQRRLALYTSNQILDVIELHVDL